MAGHRGPLRCLVKLDTLAFADWLLSREPWMGRRVKGRPLAGWGADRRRRWLTVRVEQVRPVGERRVVYATLAS